MNKTSRKIFVFILILVLTSFACQAVTNTPTPLPTALPNTITPEPTATVEVIPTPTQNSQRSFLQEDLSTKEQLSIFKDLWDVVNEEYLYEDFNGLDWDQTFLDTNLLIEAGLRNVEFYELMYELVYGLGDQHSVFLTPAEVDAEEADYLGESDYGGIGVWVSIIPERDRAVVLLTFKDGPAEKAGIKSHDSILFVGDLPVLTEHDTLSDQIIGTPGTSVTITVQTPGEDPREITLVREKIVATYPVPFETLDSPGKLKIGYLFIPTFSENSIDNQVGEALEEMGELDVLIIDNRFNGGGFDNVMGNTISYFVSGIVGHFTNRNQQEALNIRPKHIFNSQEMPLVVLVGEGTVSFGEISSGILQDQERAYLIGQTTDGNVETLWGYDFKDGSRAWIAHDTFKPINHPEIDWENDGIIPDLTVESDWDFVTLDTDPVILAALEYFDSIE